MDRLLTLAFVAEHDGQNIEKINHEDKFVLKSADHFILIKKEENGIVLSTETYDKDHVLIRKYYPNGNLIINGQSLNGKKHGDFYECYPSGKINSTYSFLDGKLHGVETHYNEDGTKISESSYVHGIQEYKKEFKEGLLKFYCIFENGVCVKIQDFSPGLVLLTESQISNGKIHGEVREYYENRVCKRIMFYHHGIIHGKEVCYDLRGKIHRTGSYFMGKKHGQFNFYNTLGNITHTEIYNEDVKI
jgi:antitoxin component YwqK of YwqJK toxin-antitoxin module